MEAQGSRKRMLAAAALLLGSIALGCDGILGIDGLETGCAEGERRCTGNTLEICDASYVWQKTDCGDLEQTCLVHPVTGVFACVGECAPGKRCLGNTPQSCNAMGQWEGSTPCNAGESCSGGSCNCIQGDRRCFENTPQLCNASNQWVDDGQPCMGQTCDPDMAACLGVCEPGKTQCLDVNTSQHCDSKGQWQTTASCTLGCLAGECAACTEGDIRCAANTQQRCSADGQWQNQAECVEQTCVAGKCLGDCTYGARRCAGKWPQACNPLGVWQLLDQPCASGESCYQGQCQALCTLGAKRCAGDAPQTCDANGQWQSDGLACGECTQCDPTMGMCKLNPTPVEDCTEPLTIEAGGVHTCALFPNGKVKCWGYNVDGQLGLGDTSDRGGVPGEMGVKLPFVDLGLDAEIAVAQLGADSYHTCALTSDGRIKCWGANFAGQLGLGDTSWHGVQPNEMGTNLPFVELGLDPGVTVAQLSAGFYHTCALSSDGRIKCWGDNDNGQLGLGDTSWRGDELNEMGINLPFVDLGLDPGVTVAQISAGADHTCALSSDGRIKCWGDNDNGQLGLGDKNHRGDEPNEMGANLPFVDLGLDPGVTVAQISAGFAHTCALTSDEGLKCWGDNEYGKLGLGDENHRGDEPNEMGAELPFIDLGLDPGVTIAQISAGHFHTCALSSDGRIKCWGLNDVGALGLEDIFNRGDEPNEMGANLPFVELGLGLSASSVRAGFTHTCALLSGGSVKCWGFNDHGQLGLFDTLSRGDQPNEMGDSLPTLDF